MRITDRKLCKQIMRMLPVYKWLPMSRFTCLKQKRIPLFASNNGVQGKHTVELDLSVLAHLPLRHSHEHIRHIPLIIATTSFFGNILGIVADEDISMRH